MADLFDNPMGLDGFEFVEFSGPDPQLFRDVFTTLGFEAVAKHRSKDVTLYRQGDINFILNDEPRTRAAFFAEEHGAGACGMAFRVKDAQYAYNRALELGAEPVDVAVSPMELKLPAIRGIGGALLYLIDRYEEGGSIYDIDFKFFEGVDRRLVVLVQFQDFAVLGDGTACIIELDISDLGNLGVKLCPALACIGRHL